MPDYLKLPGGLFFILFAFICPVSSQTPEIEKPPAEKTLFEKSIRFPVVESKNFYSKNHFRTKSQRKVRQTSVCRSPLEATAVKTLSLTVIGERQTEVCRTFLQLSKPENGAGDETDNWKLERGAKELNIEVGFAPTRPTNFNGREFDTAGRKFALLSLRWGRIIGTPKNVTYEYQIEVAPVALAVKNEVANPAFKSAAATPNIAPTVRETTYGFAVSPVGFRFLFRPDNRLKPFVGLHAGFIFFRKPVPLPQSLSYDFTGDFGGGIQYQIKKNKAVSFGYRYYHISNMNIGTINPGYNAQIFSVGYSLFYK